MNIVIKNKSAGQNLLSRVAEDSGVSLGSCLQCRRCSSGCPAAGFTGSSPSEIIRKIQLGAESDVLDSEFIWVCASCSACHARCPMKIDMASVVDSLRMIASERKSKTPAGNMPLMNKILLGTMKSFGRTYDLGAMIKYKFGTLSFFRDAAKFPMILRKGKIALLPNRHGDAESVKRIFNNIERMRKH